MPESPDRTALYRLYDASDRLLYIGITKNPEQRWYLHFHSQPWWHLVVRKGIEWHPSRAVAYAAEQDAIRSEAPYYNGPMATKGLSNTKKRQYDDSAETAQLDEALREGVATGRYKPGQILSTAALSCEYACSGLTVMGVFYDLTREGILERRGNRWRIAGGKPPKPPRPWVSRDPSPADCR